MQQAAEGEVAAAAANGGGLPPRRPLRIVLSNAQREAIVALSAAGHRPTEIAHQIGALAATVRTFLMRVRRGGSVQFVAHGGQNGLPSDARAAVLAMAQQAPGHTHQQIAEQIGELIGRTISKRTIARTIKASGGSQPGTDVKETEEAQHSSAQDTTYDTMQEESAGDAAPAAAAAADGGGSASRRPLRTVLSNEQREAIVAASAKGHRPTEIARQIGVLSTTVRTFLMRVRRGGSVQFVAHGGQNALPFDARAAVLELAQQAPGHTHQQIAAQVGDAMGRTISKRTVARTIKASGVPHAVQRSSRKKETQARQRSASLSTR
jgi:transposase